MSSMVEKKQPGRFTLQFNLKDPQQQTVSELLEQQGRHKAQFITSSVLLYIQCSKPQGHNEGPPAIDEVELEQILLSIMEKNPGLRLLLPVIHLERKILPHRLHQLQGRGKNL